MRKYNAEYLDEAAIPIPQNIDEFTDYAKYLKSIDPDENGKKDTYILKYSYINFFHDFLDIFNAFGCYPNYSHGIGFNPVTEEFEMIMLSENFPQAMGYIKGLYDEGLIANGDPRDNKALKAGTYNIASVYGLLTESNAFDEEKHGLYLVGQNINKLVHVTSGCSGLAVLNGTSGVAEKIQSLINVLAGKKESHMDFLYGEKEKKYIDTGEYYDVIRKDKDDIMVFDEISIRINLETIRLGDIIVASDGDMSYINRMSLLSVTDDKIKALISSIGNTDLIYSTPLDTQSNTVDDLNRIIRNDIRGLLKSIMDGEMSIDAAIEECQRLMKENGVSEKLKFLNSELAISD